MSGPVESPRVLGRIALPHDVSRQRIAEEDEKSKLAAVTQVVETLLIRRFTGKVELTMYRGSISRDVVVMEKHSVKLESPEPSSGQSLQDIGTIATK
jgi:hypothetical protein